MSSRAVNFRAPNIRLRIFVADSITVPDLLDINLPSDRIDTVDNDGLPTLKGVLDDSSEETCTDIDEMHIRSALNDADIIIAFYKDETILGFLLGQLKDPETLYISLICTNPMYKGVGTRLIRIIKRIASANGLKTIALDAVTSAKNFYRRRKFIENSNAPTTDHMIYNMSTYAIAESRPRKTRGGAIKPKKRRSATKKR
jgi:ribosomal protein S18 acetylase RimI-like enzyme